MNTDIQPTDDDEYVMPCAEAMLAGTLALMTGHAESACARQRTLMAQKIRSNLFFLGRHPGLTPNFRTVVHRMHGHWDTLVTGCMAAARPGVATDPADLLREQRLWHATAARVQ